VEQEQVSAQPVAAEAADVVVNRYLYLVPELLTANEANDKARPAETPEQRKARVEKMAESIAANGQEYPVLCIEVEDSGVVTYEYVDGGCRVEAIALLNSQPNVPARQVWCSLVDPKDDLFRKAVTANLHRTQNSILDMAHIVQESIERNSWKGRGAQTKVAAYLGLSTTRVNDYLKVLRAPKAIKDQILNGTLATIEAVLLLMQQPAAEQERVLADAQAVADEEERETAGAAGVEEAGQIEETADGEAGEEAGEATEPKLGRKAKKPAKVKARHIAAAVRKSGGGTAKRSRGDMVTLLRDWSKDEGLRQPARDWASYMASTWLPGMGTSATARSKFAAATGGEALASGKPSGPKSNIGKAIAAEKAKKLAAKAKGKKGKK